MPTRPRLEVILQRFIGDLKEKRRIGSKKYWEEAQNERRTLLVKVRWRYGVGTVAGCIRNYWFLPNLKAVFQLRRLEQCLSTAGPRARYRGPGINYTGHARGSPGIYHFSFLKQFFMNKCFVVEIFLRSKKYSWMCRKKLRPRCWPEGKLQYATRFH